jgi:hypothetical protein
MLMMPTMPRRGAIIIDPYRYLLWRTWNPAGKPLAFLMLNPSTADATTDDPTVRRCLSFARDWGFGALYVVNLFAYRATSPRDLLAAADPVGPENDAAIRQAAQHSACLVAAWGGYGRYRGRDREVMELLTVQGCQVWCLGCNQDGSPKHPLYIRKGTQRHAFSYAG